MASTLIQIALGGALGASARWLAVLLIGRIAGPGFPLGVITVNVLGSLAMGAFVVAANNSAQIQLSPFVMTGLLGGFTTFSSFSLEAVLLVERGQVWQAAIYVAASVFVSIGALLLGMTSMRAVLA